MSDSTMLDESGKPIAGAYQRKNSWKIGQNLPRLRGSRRQTSSTPNLDVSIRIKEPWTCTTQTPPRVRSPRPPLPVKPLPSTPANLRRKNSKHIPPAKPLPSPPELKPRSLSEGSVIRAPASSSEELYFTKKYHRLSCSAPLIQLRKVSLPHCFRVETEPTISMMSEDGKGEPLQDSRRKKKKKTPSLLRKSEPSAETKEKPSTCMSMRASAPELKDQDSPRRARSQRQTTKKRHRHSLALLLTPSRACLAHHLKSDSDDQSNDDGDFKSKSVLDDSSSPKSVRKKRAGRRRSTTFHPKTKSSSKRASAEIKSPSKSTPKKKKKTTQQLAPEIPKEDDLQPVSHVYSDLEPIPETDNSREIASPPAAAVTKSSKSERSPRAIKSPKKQKHLDEPHHKKKSSKHKSHRQAKRKSIRIVSQEQVWDCLERNECTIDLNEGGDILQRLYLCVTCQENEKRQRDRLENRPPLTPRDILQQLEETQFSSANLVEYGLPHNYYESKSEKAQLLRDQRHHAICESCAGVCHVGHTFVVLGQMMGCCGCATTCGVCTSGTSHSSNAAPQAQLLSPLTARQVRLSPPKHLKRPACRARAVAGKV
eukprot:TRINITY_DN5085_c0_g1_i1.p1 TRINITY_DN5085_c0_g1~~TRINITY_DN5085_c0_g1_i1.p1  ORF type:complete len:595 (-),score=83.54 TRINITY_DN5085_c0_g1_i1:946-2730(-)